MEQRDKMLQNAADYGNVPNPHNTTLCFLPSSFHKGRGLHTEIVSEKGGSMTGFIFVQHLRVFKTVMLFGKLHFIHTSTNAITDDHKYSPLPSTDFDSSEVLVSFSAFIFT